MQTTDTPFLKALQEQRTELRSRLAQAWEMREPDEQIREIELQMQSIWAQMEAEAARTA